MASPLETREDIVDAALALAELRSWEAVRLHDVAAALGITLDDIRLFFSEKEDVVEAWFDRADSAMLRAAEAEGFCRLQPRERIHHLVMTWLDALSAHRRVTRQMILGKMEAGHIHIQIPGIMRISRTVQWIREAAHRDATYMHRALEETVLTSIYLMTFFHWMYDDSPHAIRTSRFLEGWLSLAQAGERLAFGLLDALPRAR